MHNIYLKDLLRLCNGKLIQGIEETILCDFSKDTRTIVKNDIFVGIKGENFDGNTLYKEAIEKGCIGCILNSYIDIDLDYLKNYSNVFIVLVDDTIEALKELATYKRSLYDIPVIGITGSVGKTSTKDIIASVLEKKFNVLKTLGNYNNHIGLPLTILSLKEHDLLVVEMGMNNLGEISILSKIAKPTISVITNIGTSHIGNLGSRENILKAKLEILDGMDNYGVVVINNDNDLLHEWYLNNKNNYNIITYGIDNDSLVMAKNIITNDSYSEFYVDDFKYRINIPGIHFVTNSLSAISIGKYFKLDDNLIKNGILDFNLSKNRMDIYNINNITIINDCYNANADSMKSAINYLGSLKRRKIAILGDMLELGSYSEELHRMIGKSIIDNKIDIIITVGDNAKYIINELKDNNYNLSSIYHFDNNKDAINKVKNIIKDEDVILIKASYGMHFMEINDALKSLSN